MSAIEDLEENLDDIHGSLSNNSSASFSSLFDSLENVEIQIGRAYKAVKGMALSTRLQEIVDEYDSKIVELESEIEDLKAELEVAKGNPQEE